MLDGAEIKKTIEFFLDLRTHSKGHGTRLVETEVSLRLDVEVCLVFHKPNKSINKEILKLVVPFDALTAIKSFI